MGCLLRRRKENEVPTKDEVSWKESGEMRVKAKKIEKAASAL